MSERQIIRVGPRPVPSRPRRLWEAIRSSWSAPLSSTSPELARLWGASAKTFSGVPVNHANAMTFSAVFDAVNQISSDVAKLPLNLYKRRQDGGSDLYADAKLYRLLKYEPNAEMGSMVFRRTIVAHALTWGNGYAEIERDALGKPAAFWPITPDRVTIERDGKALRYRVTNYQTADAVYQPKDMIHIPGPSFDGTCGYDVIQLARQAIGLALAAEQSGASFFGNGSSFGGILTSDIAPTKEEAEAMQKLVEQMHQGPDRAHRIAAFWGGWKYQQLGVTPNEAQHNETRARQVEEVARFFNIPVHKLKNLDRATNNNIEQQDLEYYKGCLLTWITLLEEEFNRKTIAPLEARQQYIKHNANAFLRGDIKSRYDALGIARDKGIINADEWRELEEMNPQPDGQGKLYLVQQAQVPVNLIAKLTESQIKKNETPKAVPAPPSADTPPNDAAVRALQDRLTLAEQAVSDATALAQSERALRVAAEATATATVEEIAGYRTREQAHLGVAAELEAIRASIASDLAAAKQAEATSALTAADATRRAEEAGAAAQTLRERMTALEPVIAERDATVAALASAEARCAALASSETASVTERQAAEAARDAAQAELTRQTELATVALDAAAEAERDLQRAVSAETAAREALHVLHAEMAEVRAQAEASRIAAAQALTTATHEAETRTRVEAASLTAEAARAAAEQALRAAQQADESATGEVIAAHRALFEHTMALMVGRECERARRQQQSPDKLRAWVDAWYESHDALMTQALRPIAQVHLAFTRSSVPVGEFVAGLVAAHIAESKRQMAAVLDGDAGALAASVAQLLIRWETERPAAFADRLFAEEIAYVRRRTAA